MRRRFFLLAAPAIVAAPSLMRVSSAVLDMLGPVEEELKYSLSDLITTTLRNRSHKLAEHVTQNNAILRMLSERGEVFPPAPMRMSWTEQRLVTKG